MLSITLSSLLIRSASRRRWPIARWPGHERTLLAYPPGAPQLSGQPQTWPPDLWSPDYCWGDAESKPPRPAPVPTGPLALVSGLPRPGLPGPGGRFAVWG